MKLHERPEVILKAVAERHPEIEEVLAGVREMVPQTKREIVPYQGAVLYALAKPFDVQGAKALEIGTAFGYS